MTNTAKQSKIDETKERIRKILRDLCINDKEYHLYTVHKAEENEEPYILVMNSYSLNSEEITLTFDKTEKYDTIKDKMKKLNAKEKNSKMKW